MGVCVVDGGGFGLSVSRAAEVAHVPSGRSSSGRLGRSSWETSVVLLTDFT